MRIRWVKAIAFGALVDQTLNLHDGLNVVVGPNESGKSTWHAALFAALCGRSEELEATADSEFDRKPWHSAGWAIEAMLDRDNDDPVLLYQDLLNPASATATELSGPQDGGRHDISPALRYHGGLDTSGWVGLDRHSYAATAWVQQGSGRNQLSEAVGLCIREEDAIQACARIERLRYRHIGDPNDMASPLGRAEAELVERTADRNELRDLHDQLGRAQAEFNQWSSFLQIKEQELYAAELAAAQHRVVELQSDLRQYADDPFAKPYGAGVVNSTTHDAVVAAERELRVAEQALVAAATRPMPRPAPVVHATAHVEPVRETRVSVRETRPAAVDPNSMVDTELQLDEAELEQPMVGSPSIEYEPGLYETRRRSRWRALRQPEGRALVIGLMAVLVVAAGVGLAVLLGSVPLGAILVAIGLGLAVVAVIQGLRNPVRDELIPVPISPAVAVEEVVLAPIVISAEPEPSPVYESPAVQSTVELDDSRVRDARRHLAWALRQVGYDADLDTVDTWLARYHDERSQQERSELERQAREAAQRGTIEERLAQAQADVARLASQIDPNTPMRVTLPSPDQARAAYEQADRERQRATMARDNTANQLANRITLAAADTAVEDARRRLSALRRLGDLLDEAHGYLNRSRVGARREIASALETSVGRSLPHITDGHYPHVTISATDFRISISDPAEAALDPMRGARSTREQTYLSARVALGEQLSRRRLYGPLLLDDVTSSADGPRVNGLLDLLYRFAQVRQVVVFAHEESVAQWAERMMGTHDNVHLIRLSGPDRAPAEVVLTGE